MALPDFTMRQLLEAGVHFGHQTRRWNPAMAPYIFGVRNGVHVIDLTQTVPMLYRALETARNVAAGGGRVLFVGTKRQAQEPVARAAARCGQYYVNHRWLGGMLTNWRTISQSIRRLRELEQRLGDQQTQQGLTKRELLELTRERDKLEQSLGGIKDMGGLPDILFIIDTNKEDIAVNEANKLGLPVIGVLDSNSNPKGISLPVPGNDDASRAINFYCDLMVAAVLDGIQAEMSASGVDLGASDDLEVEDDYAELEADAGAGTEASEPAVDAVHTPPPASEDEPATAEATLADQLSPEQVEAVQAAAEPESEGGEAGDEPAGGEQAGGDAAEVAIIEDESKVSTPA